MTLLNATLLPHGAWVSADTWVSPTMPGAMLLPNVSADPAKARRNLARTIRTSPRTSPLPAPIGDVVKVRAWSGRRVITGATGHLVLFQAWVRALDSDLAGPLDELVKDAPARLRVIATANPGTALLALLLGWSDRQGRCAGYSLAPPDFRAEPLLDGHANVPQPNPSAPDYPALYNLWQAAAQGRDVERCHREMAASQVRTYRAGLYVEDIAFGGDLWMAEATERGAACRFLCRL